MKKPIKEQSSSILVRLMTLASILGFSPAVNALTINFQGNINIDFSSDPVLGDLIGTQTLSVDDNINLPFTTAEILESLADGDSTIPASFLLERFFPQEIIPDTLTLDNINITDFSGMGSVSSAQGFLTNFDFAYQTILDQPVIELTNFNKNLAQCVFIQCQYGINSNNPAILTATFEATLLNPLMSSLSITNTITNTNTTLTVENAPVTASLSTQSTPESSSWAIVPIILGGMAVLKRDSNSNTPN